VENSIEYTKPDLNLQQGWLAAPVVILAGTESKLLLSKYILLKVGMHREFTIYIRPLDPGIVHQIFETNPPYFR
jgi:hypothetical protein